MSFISKTFGKIVGHQTNNKQQSQSQLGQGTGATAGGVGANQHHLHYQPQQQQQQHPHEKQYTFQATSSAALPPNSFHSNLQSNQDAQLTLTHLRKLFYEYLHPKQINHELTQSERDDKLYSILPLFIKAFGHCSLVDINEKFSDIGEFCFACSKLLVNEISKRVHDDLVLVKFFEIKTTEDATDGSGLLNTVNLLASGPLFLIEIMTKCSLPSRLVMCVYLFICLPEAKDSLLDNCEFNAKERRILFQKCFQQLLLKLSQNGCTCDELVEADSLKLLFKIIASTCEQHNVPWRQTATDALLILTKNFNPKSLNYVHHNECIQTCLQCFDPDDICTANLIERTDLLITLITFLRETCFISQQLMDDFRQTSGYRIATDMVLRLEKENTSETKQALKRLLACLEEFVYAGFNELRPNLSNLNTNMFKLDGFQVPQPLGRGKTVRNTHGFQCLLNLFNKVQSFDVCMLVLECIKNLYKKDECNYFILESQNLVLYSLDDTSVKIYQKSNEIQIKFIELLEFIAFNLKFVPCKELVSIGLTIQNYNCNKWSINCANFLLKLIRTNPTYKEAFRELGLLEMSVSCLQKFANLLKEKHANNNNANNSGHLTDTQSASKEIHIDAQQKELGFLIMDIICCLLAQNSTNAKIFRELGGARVAHNMVPYKLCRNQALNIVSTLLLSTAGEDDMSTLLGLMHTAQMEDLELKNAVLKSLLHTLRESHRTRTVFRKAGGFVYVVSVLISMEGSLSTPAKAPWQNVKKQDVFSIIRTILHTLAVSMRYEPANAKFFETEVRWKSLRAALKLLGCFDPNKTQFEPRTNNDFVKRGYDVFEQFFCNLDDYSLLQQQQPQQQQQQQQSELSSPSLFLHPSNDTDSHLNSSLSSPSKLSHYNQMDEKLIFVCYIMRFLYDTAIDSFDKPFNRYPNRYYNTLLSESAANKTSLTSTLSVTGNHGELIAASGGGGGGGGSAHATRGSSPVRRTNSALASNSSSSTSSCSSFINSSTGFLDEPFIIHPGAISTILHLLTQVTSDKSEHMATRLQYHMISLIKNLLKYERNQQIMSNAQFVDDLLTTCRHILNDETHFLNSSIQHIFERLATQSISAKCLREYLRLGTVFETGFKLPLAATSSMLIPLNRVKCLISMTTPRDCKQYLGTCFVEFNMVVEGFGCLFLPSIAPQLTNAPSIVAMGMVSVGNDLSVNGGVGSGERVFPPQSGLTYSTWIYIEKFTSCVDQPAKSDKASSPLQQTAPGHPIRILTLIKHSKTKDTLSSCLAVYLSPKNRSLFVSTEEVLLQHQKFDTKSDQELKQTDHTTKFNCSELFQEGQWLHLVLVWSRAVLKNSTVTLYVNSNLIGTQKLHYINSTTMGANTAPSSMSIHACIGTLPIFRAQYPVVWRQASCYLFEDILQAPTVYALYQLGPNYLGSFQSCDFNSTSSSTSDPAGHSWSGSGQNSGTGTGAGANATTANLAAALGSSLISEEKILFGLHPQKCFEMTLSKFRKVYNKNDSKAIGKQLNIPSNENVTPLRILSNTGAQLNGPARTVGGVLIGYMGVRTFQPIPVSKSIEHVGGVWFLLGLIAMSNDIEFMYASVKALVCIVRSNVEIAREIERLNGYQLLAMLYKRKKHLINSHILNLTFSLAINDDNGKEQAVIANVKAFECLLCDLDIWYDTPVEIQRSLHERFNELLNDQSTINSRFFQRYGMLKRLLFTIKEPLAESTLKFILSTIRILLLEANASGDDLLKYGQYLAALLPDKSLDENQLDLDSTDESLKHVIYTIKLRNKLIYIIDDIVSQSTSNKMINFQEELQKSLGYDWFLLFMQPNVHHTTLIRMVKILFQLLLNIQNLNRFKESSLNGGWLNNVVAYNQLHHHHHHHGQHHATPHFYTQTSTADLTSPSNVTSTASLTLEVNTDACTAPGFQIMQYFFARNAHLTELYYLLFALLFDAQRIKELPVDAELDLNTICRYVFDKSFDSEQTLFCKINTDVSLDMTIILFGMCRTLMNPLPAPEESNNGSSRLGTSLPSPTTESIDNGKTKDYAIILLQIFRFMYHNCDEFRSMSNNADFLSALIATLYPVMELTQQQLVSPAPIEIKPFAEAICDAQAKNTYKSFLTIHPARKLVMDFLRDLLFDWIMLTNANMSLSSQLVRSLTLSSSTAVATTTSSSSSSVSGSSSSASSSSSGSSQSSQSLTIVDAILISLPDMSAVKRNQEFITELFKTVTDYLSSCDLLNEHATPVGSSGNVQQQLANFYILIDRLVDKLWDGMYKRDPKEVFDLLMKYLNNLKKKPFSSQNTFEPLVNSINRVLLYQLSRTTRTLNEQIAMLDVLHKINKLKTFFFFTTTQSNIQIQPEFYGCLAHCLLQLTLNKSPSVSSSGGPNSPTARNNSIVAEQDDHPDESNNTGMKRTVRSESRENIVDLNKHFQSKTQWYINTMFNETVTNSLTAAGASVGGVEDKDSIKNAKALLNSAAQRVWLDLYLSKKSQLEECLKVNLNSIGKNPTLDELRPVIIEPALKIWTAFIDGEKKLPERIQSQIQAKFQRVTGGISNMAGGFSRVVSLKKQKKEIARLNPSELVNTATAIGGNLLALIDYVESEYRKHVRLNEQRHMYLYQEWLKIERELLRERALWGEDVENALNKWKLDMTEGPNRQRKRLLANTDEFYRNYPYRLELESSALASKPNRKYKIPSSFDSREYFRQFQVKSLIHFNQYMQEYVQLQQEIQQYIETNTQSNAECASASDADQLANSSATVGTASQSEIDSMMEIKRKINKSNNLEISKDQDNIFDETNGADSNAINEKSTISLTMTGVSCTSNNQNITRLLEEGEKINHIYRCARVQGLDTTEGVFLFGKEHFYVLDGYTLISTKDIVDIDTLKSSTYEPLIPKCTNGSSSSSAPPNSVLNSTTSEKTCSKFAYEDIREVHNRRYLLQEIAMEIFSNDGRNYLLVFPRKCRNKIYDRLIALTPDLNDSASQSIAGQRRSINIEANSGLFNALIGEKSVVQRWERGEITNFQYLMFLNTLAGRSYNDLMQYPVFPWILADYESPELDLTHPNTFRDLSKPMGAQTTDRLKQFEKRYMEWEDPTGETPPYHYGTHYSSAMIVASYLVRLEPFTQIFLRLQGGHFDLADRMFHSIRDSWLSASKNNMADVKELIPEFFYLPEFLVNSNKFDLGKKQSGVVLNDVVLPTWAKNDPREFIRVHRAALESDYVSAHLHEWIDLIFGHKQQGQPAVESMNVFHHLFYEGAVNIDEIDDPLKRNAIIGFINNFGQIPKQLFKKPHPSKKLNSQLLYGIAGGLIGSSLGSTAANLANTMSSSTAALVPGNQTAQSMADSDSNNHQQAVVQSTLPFIFIHYLKNLKPSMQPIKELKSQVGQIVCLEKGGLYVVEQNKFLMPPNYQRYIAWGFTDESIKIGYTDYEKSYVTFENIQDGAIFSCCSPDSKIIITAGTSTVVNVWELSKLKYRRLQLKARLYGHSDTVTCMAVSNQYHMLVTGSRDHSCIIWDINRWSFVRQLPNHYGAVSCICINELTGDIATASSTYLYLWNINGELLASINTITSSRNHLVLCVYMSQVNEWDNNNVILTGGTDGIVRMWSLDYTQVKIDADQSDANCKTRSSSLLQSKTIDLPSVTAESDCTSASCATALDKTKDGNKFFPDNFSPSAVDATSEHTPTTFYTENNDSDTEQAPQKQPSPNPANPETSSPSTIIAGSAAVASNNSYELDEDFVVIESSNSIVAENKATLKPGYKWKAELTFKSKLTMHTSYDRKDNNEPASVTALCISKDNKTIYVGDSRGRVFTWVCTENPGKTRADHWLKDDVCEQCRVCHVKFTFSERKHHCRDCGGIFCHACTKYEIDIPRLHINKPVRVCLQCYQSNVALAKESNASSPTTPATASNLN